MSIAYDSKRRLFILENARIEYAFFIDGQNYLRHLYFGKKIAPFSFSSLIDLGWDWSKTYQSPSEEEKIYADAYSSSASLMEVSSSGRFDRRGALIVFRQEDGSYLTDFFYRSHRIYEGLPVLNDLPCVSSNGGKASSVEIVLEDALSHAELILTFSLIDDLDVIVRSSKLVNPTEKDISVERMFSLMLDLPGSAYDLIHFPGDWAMERNVSRHPLRQERVIVESEFGTSSHMANPFNILIESRGNEDYGEAFGFNFLWSGNFRFEVNVDKFHSTRVLLGINDANFDYRLKAGSETELPQGIIACSSKGLNGLSAVLHDLIRDHIVRDSRAKEYRPLLFNSWEGCYLNFTTESILEYMDRAKEIGAELFVLDDGWFGDRDEDDRGLGDWFVHSSKIDLKKVIDRCHDLGMKFGLWFEPEMVNPKSRFYRENPFSSLGHRNLDRELSRHQFYLDLTDPEIIERIASQVNRILDTYAIDYVKWDHNRPVADTFSYHLHKEDQGKVSYLMTMGFYSLCRKIIDRHPEIFFEGCASGGGRFDLGMAYFFPQIWCSDETDPVQRLYIQYGTSMGYPLSMIGSHVSKHPLTSYKTKSDIAFFGTYGYEFDPTRLSESEKDELRENLGLYRAIHQDVILNGDLYRIYSPFDSNYFAQIAVSKEKSDAVFLFVNLRKENNSYRFVRLKGLDPEKQYRNSLDKQVYSGDYYLNVGLNLTRWIDEFTSFLVVLHEEKNPSAR